jgi:4-alpha-glucanotransferase
MYENSFAEKEKFWKLVGLKGKVRENCDKEIITSALKLSLQSNAVFAINLITDLLYMMDCYKGDSYQYRFNVPGTISAKNWSQTLPISLEDLLNHKANKDLLALVRDSKRKTQ